jgi:hypothetical protein
MQERKQYGYKYCVRLIGLVQQARIVCDSQSAIFSVKNPTYHSKTKHIDVQYHFVRDMVEDKKVLLMKVDTLKNVADSLTKSMRIDKFYWCRGSMGIFPWIVDYVIYNPLYAKKTTSGRMLVCVILFAILVPCTIH